MPNFNYVAINIKGNQIKGEHSSPDEKGVANMLLQQGYYVTSIKKAGGALSINTGSRRLPIKEVARLCTQVSSMLRSGVPIVRTLEILANETEYKPLKVILEDINSSISQGSSLS
ncbi:MAG: type II secretion system F family protein, partial [Clostridiales bacterium]|nr:type II secretion system F family protein [Clostridiales bacterium]